MTQEETLKQTKEFTLDTILKVIKENSQDGMVSAVFFNQNIKEETKFELVKLGYRLKTGVDNLHTPYLNVTWL